LTTKKNRAVTHSGEVVEGHRHRSDRRRTVGRRDDHLLAPRLHAVDTGQPRHRLAGGLGIAVEAGHDHVVPHASLELLRRALGDESPAMDDADPVGQLVGLLQVLGGQEDGHVELPVEPAAGRMARSSPATPTVSPPSAC
jgi:hypothetical protein